MDCRWEGRRETEKRDLRSWDILGWVGWVSFIESEFLWVNCPGCPEPCFVDQPGLEFIRILPPLLPRLLRLKACAIMPGRDGFF